MVIVFGILVLAGLIGFLFFVRWSGNGGAAKTRALRCLVRYFECRSAMDHDHALVQMVRMLFPESSECAKVIWVGAQHEEATSDRAELMYVIGAVNVVSNLIPVNDPGGHKFIYWLEHAINDYVDSYRIEVSTEQREPNPNRFIKSSSL